MSANRRKPRKARPSRPVQYRVRGIRRQPPDVRKFSQALIGLALAEAERQAEAEHTKRTTPEAAADDATGTDRPDGRRR